MNRYPKSRDFEIVVQETGNELLVYDLINNKTHLLNETSAVIWQNCDGKTSILEIAQRENLPEEFVAFAIDKLQKINLMAEKFELSIPQDQLSRRKILMKIGATAAALPLITSLVAPRAIHAQSGACLPNGGNFELTPSPFFADINECVNALISAAQTRCCSGSLNPQSGFVFGTNPPLCRGICGQTIG